MQISLLFFLSLPWLSGTVHSFPVISPVLIRGGGVAEQKGVFLLRNKRKNSALAVAAKPVLEEKAKPKKKRSIFVTLWIHLISIFLLVNSRVENCWPAALTTVSFSKLSFIHAISAMLFSGSIITTTVLEWLVVTSRDAAVQQFWFDKVPQVEKWIVIPALTGSMVSGVGQAFSHYGSLRHAPRHVKSTMHVLTLFGLWWGITDRTTQSKAHEMALKQRGSLDSQIPSVFQQRRISNVISCVFLVALYGIMILKPR